MSRAQTQQLRTKEVAKFLRRRRFRHFFAWSVVAGLILLSIADYALTASGDDWARFDRQSFQVIAVESGDQLVISTGKSRQRIQLLGITASDESRPYTEQKLLGKSITVLLTKPQTRNDRGDLLAFAFLTPADNFNIDLVHDGYAKVDHGQTTPMQSQLDGAQADARKKGRGMWSHHSPANQSS